MKSFVVSHVSSAALRSLVPAGFAVESGGWAFKVEEGETTAAVLFGLLRPELPELSLLRCEQAIERHPSHWKGTRP